MGKKDPLRGAKDFIASTIPPFVRRYGSMLQEVTLERRRHTVPAPDAAGDIKPGDVYMALLGLYSDLAKQDEVKGLVAEHDKHPILLAKAKDLRAWEKRYAISLDKLFLGAAARYAFLRIAGATDSTALAEVLSGFAVLMTGKKCGMVLGAALPGLGLPEKGVALDEGTDLRPLTPEESSFALPAEYGSDRAALLWRRRPSFPGIVLTGRRRTIDSYVQTWPPMTDEFLIPLRTAVGFLQLEIDDGIRPARLFVANDRWVPSGYGEVGILSSQIQPYVEPPVGSPETGPEYPIDSKLGTRLTDRWPRYKLALKDRRFRRACSRYSLSLHRGSPEDTLIDHWIGLEALFSRDTREIGMVVASKMAILLGKGLDDRRKLRKQVLAHYAIRSALVHGGEGRSQRLKRFRKTVESIIPEALDMTPQIAALFSGWWLKGSLFRLTDHFKSLDELDDALMSGSLKCDLPKLPTNLRVLAALARDKGSRDKG